MATGGAVARRVASTLSSSSSSVCGQATQTAKAARATTGEAAQLQGGPSGGQGKRNKQPKTDPCKDRKGPHPTLHRSRPYKATIPLSSLTVVFVRARVGLMWVWDPCGRSQGSLER